MTELSTQIPTHKLIIKHSDGYKEFLLMSEDARKIRENINSADQFITIKGEAYPKFGAEIRVLTNSEFEKIREISNTKNIHSEYQKRDHEKQKEKRELKERIDSWIEGHQDEYQEIYQSLLMEVESEDSPFSEEMVANIAAARARSEILELLSK
ncbi:MAG: hypothetical protein GY861_18515 [bacterium]|nr:hypothetical protein [bacterium]